MKERLPLRPAIRTREEVMKHLEEDHQTLPIRTQDKVLPLDFHRDLHRRGDAYGVPHTHEQIDQRTQLRWYGEKPTE